MGNRAIVNNAGTINAAVFGAGNRRVRRRCPDHEQRGDQCRRQRSRDPAQGDRAVITHLGTINGGVGSAGVAYNGSSGTINQ